MDLNCGSIIFVYGLVVLDKKLIWEGFIDMYFCNFFRVCMWFGMFDGNLFILLYGLFGLEDMCIEDN